MLIGNGIRCQRKIFLISFPYRKRKIRELTLFPRISIFYFRTVTYIEITAWEQRKLSDVLSLIKDGTHGTHADATDGPLLLSAKNIKDGTIKWDDSDRRISKEEYEKIHSNFSLKNGDVLLTIVGSIGETAILRDSKGLTFQRSVAFLRPCDDITSEFLYTEIQTASFHKELENRKSTSAQPGIYLGDLGEIPFAFPIQKDEQERIGELFTNIDNTITLHQRKQKNTNLGLPSTSSQGQCPDSQVPE